MKLAALFVALAGLSAAQMTGTAARAVARPALLKGGGGTPTRIPLATFADLEKRFDTKLTSIGGANDPLDLLGTTRGVYLEGYGVVFTSELSLIVTPNTNPFRQTITDQLKAQVHQRKIARVPELKASMKEMLKTAAMTIIQVPDAQSFVFAVRLDYLKWEDTMGLPGLIVMKADRKAALAGDFRVEEQ